MNPAMNIRAKAVVVARNTGRPATFARNGCFPPIAALLTAVAVIAAKLFIPALKA